MIVKEHERNHKFVKSAFTSYGLFELNVTFVDSIVIKRHGNLHVIVPVSHPYLCSPPNLGDLQLRVVNVEKLPRSFVLNSNAKILVHSRHHSIDTRLKERPN